jgi:hypothetical protein
MSSSTASFEVLPFRGDGAAQSEEIRRRMGGSGPRSPGAIGYKRGIYHGAHRPPYGLRRPIGGYDPAVMQTAAAPDYTQTTPSGAAPSEQIRWVQFALNQIQNANLPTDGVASPDLRAALRDFQRQSGLPVSGFIGPDTIASLQGAGKTELETGSADWELELTDSQVTAIQAELDDDTKAVNLMSNIDRFPRTAGLYRITWLGGGNYYGIAVSERGGLRKRLKDHITEVGQLGYRPTEHKVTIKRMGQYKTENIKDAEKKIRERVVGIKPGNTNQREMEFLEIELN